jgi:RNA polymerase sigma-70 factor (ECF subfamily)
VNDRAGSLDDSDQTHVFNRYRHRLIGIAYRILGSMNDAEDVVQDVWLRWIRVDPGIVIDPQSFLVTATSRAAIDRLRRAQLERTSYIGPWLPEPILTVPDAAEEVELAESVSMAMMVVLETLSPLERAVFVLREAFDFSYREIAEVLGRSETAVRQLGHRARDHVTRRKPRFTADHATLNRVTARFMHACTEGDLSDLLQILSPDVELVADSGGVARAPRRSLVGPGNIARFLVSVWESAGLSDPQVRLTELNGSPGIVVTAAGSPVAAFLLDIADDVVQKIYLVANPGKLAHVAETPGA